MPERTSIPGKFVWFELVASDRAKAQAFYREVLAWKSSAFPVGGEYYEMIFTGDTPDTMIGAYASPQDKGLPSRWLSYVSVEDVDATAKLAAANGARIVDAPRDLPTAGRSARIRDPQGAELCLFKSARGDAPDRPTAPAGSFFWNTLHTTEVEKALDFYRKVFGFTYETVNGAGGGAYHVLSSKDGVGRGGVSSHLPAGTAAHWEPYVSVADVDATAARAKKYGGTVPIDPVDIPGTGRRATLCDPTGAAFAVMKPSPR